MKKLLLILSVFAVVNVYSQSINNYSFEQWAEDTFYLGADVLGSLPADTAYFLDPVGWTTSNAITQLDSFGSVSLVTPDSDAFVGSLAAKMTTANIHIGVPPIVSGEYALPGFMLNGKFPINLNTLLLSAITSGGVGTLTPASVQGAGQPITHRLASIRGHYNYEPVFDTLTNAYDTCLIYATLRKDTEIIANAIYKSNNQTEAYGVFQVDFQYVSCDMPDTLVILIASSVPNLKQLLTGNSTVIAGSHLWVDSLGYTVLPDDYTFSPFVSPVTSTTPENTPDTINVVANDSDCSVTPLVISVAKNPQHGVAALLDSLVIYTPDLGFYGSDSLLYKATDTTTNDTARAWIYITVQYNTAITGPYLIPLQVYPVPSSGELNVRFDYSGTVYAKVFDVLGNVVYQGVMKGSTNTLQLQYLTNGFYNLQLSNEGGSVIARSKFIIDR